MFGQCDRAPDMSIRKLAWLHGLSSILLRKIKKGWTRHVDLAAAQELPADECRAAAAAPMAVRRRAPGPLIATRPMRELPPAAGLVTPSGSAQREPCRALAADSAAQ